MFIVSFLSRCVLIDSRLCYSCYSHYCLPCYWYASYYYYWVRYCTVPFFGFLFPHVYGLLCTFTFRILYCTSFRSAPAFIPLLRSRLPCPFLYIRYQFRWLHLVLMSHSLLLHVHICHRSGTVLMMLFILHSSPCCCHYSFCCFHLPPWWILHTLTLWFLPLWYPHCLWFSLCWFLHTLPLQFLCCYLPLHTCVHSSTLLLLLLSVTFIPCSIDDDVV